MNSPLKLPSRILVVDKDESAYRQLQSQMKNYPVELAWTSDIDTAVDWNRKNSFDAAVIQREFDHLSGLTMVQKLRVGEIESGEYTAMIISTGERLGLEERSLYKELGDMETLSKPYEGVKVIPVLHKTAIKKEKHKGLYDSYSEAIEENIRAK